MPQWVLDLLFLPPEGSSASFQIDALHVFVISVTMVSSLAVFVAGGYLVVRYQQRRGQETTEHVEASVLGETVMIGGILSLFLIWWVIGYRQYVKLVTPPPDAMTVYVTAKQWMWKFTYEDGRSANDVLTVPLGRPVKLVMTSRDVIHSFYVPAFRNKQDVLPGRYTTFWFEPSLAGSFPIYCAEYCGTSHSLMRGNVVVLPVDEYQRWLARPTRDASGETDLLSHGEQVARTRECLACHTTDGQRHIGPSWAGLYGSEVAMNDGRKVVADEAYLTRSMMEPTADIVAGFKPVMPSFFGLLSAPEAAALVEYIKSLRDVRPPTGVRLPELSVSPLSMADAGAPDGGVPLLPRLP